jgi:hypothetical protein
MPGDPCRAVLELHVSNRCEPHGVVRLATMIKPHESSLSRVDLEWKVGIDERRTHLKRGV